MCLFEISLNRADQEYQYNSTLNQIHFLFKNSPLDRFLEVVVEQDQLVAAARHPLQQIWVFGRLLLAPRLVG